MTDALLCPQGVATWPDEPADVVRIVRPEGARRRRRPRAPAGADPRSTPDWSGRRSGGGRMPCAGLRGDGAEAGGNPFPPREATWIPAVKAASFRACWARVPGLDTGCSRSPG